MGLIIAFIVIILAIALPEIIFGMSSGTKRPTEHQCPYCGSHDTDGNHCFDCGHDF